MIGHNFDAGEWDGHKALPEVFRREGSFASKKVEPAGSNSSPGEQRLHIIKGHAHEEYFDELSVFHHRSEISGVEFDYESGSKEKSLISDVVTDFREGSGQPRQESGRRRTQGEYRGCCDSDDSSDGPA